MFSRRQSVLAVSAVSVIAGAAAGQNSPPTFTVTPTDKTGDNITNIPSVGGSVGPITGPEVYPGGGQGVLQVAVNNSGAWLMHVATTVASSEAIVRSQNQYQAYMAEQNAGYLSVPTSTATPANFFSFDLNDSGNGLYGLGLYTDDFSMIPTSAVVYNNNVLLFQQGDALNATGVAAGTVWNPLDSNTHVALNDANQALVVSTVTENSVSRRVVVRFQLDANGNVTGTTLVAKEGGPVGAGPDTWATIAGGTHASAMNTYGTVVFSGTTAGGTNGIYTSPGGFIAVTGGATPVSPNVWGSLVGSPVDINAKGIVAFRSYTGNGSGVFNEVGDAGDVVDAENHTFGNGPLTQINGTLSTDWDVDMYRITVTDATSFSATTVPSGGFPGANFGTVLSVISEPGYGTSPRNQCVQTSSSVAQSTIGNTNVVTGRTYYLAVSTPKSRCMSAVQNYSVQNGYGNVNRETWQSDPGAVAVNAGLVYWPIPSAAVLRSVTTAGVAQPDISLPYATSKFVIDSVHSKVYWADQNPSGAKIRQCNFDGSSPTDIVTGTGWDPTQINGQDVSGLALDLVSVPNKLYWTKSVFGEIDRCNLDGSSLERVIQDYPPSSLSIPAALPTNTFAPNAIAIDPAGGHIYWYNIWLNAIERSNLDGTGRTTLASGAGASAIALDLTAGKVYWSNTLGGSIQRSNLDGTTIETVISASGPVGLALDSGYVYWTDIVNRQIQRALITSPSASTIVAIGPSVGQRVPDGAGAGSPFVSWQRLGTQGSTALPYSVKLTGAGFQFPLTMIAKSNGVKLAMTGDVIPGTSPYTITTLSNDNGPIKMSDRGDIAWTGQYYAPTIYTNYITDGLFFNGQLLLNAMQVVSSAGGQRVTYFYGGGDALRFSHDGNTMMLALNMQDPPFNFTPQRDNGLVFSFSLPAACVADFNQDGQVTVQDIFAFLTAWFAKSPTADIGHSGTPTVQDIFSFLSHWFGKC